MAKDTRDGANDIFIHMILRLNPLVRETLAQRTSFTTLRLHGGDDTASAR